jgi:hypothetical protein
VNFALWSLPYSYLRIGPDHEDLTDDQDYPEAQEDFEEMLGSRPFMI